MSGNDSIEARFHRSFAGFSLDVDLLLPARGVTAIFGPSGSGKTTLLRCIAGLEHAPGARLRIGDETWQDAERFLPPHRRPVGYVFQEANLFAHLDVTGNLNFGAQRTGMTETPDRNAIIGMLGIGHLLGRDVQALSGGERQRVAIARALLAAPRLLLMDEPLAALDRERKREILPYLERLRNELDIPILYVSHAIDELSRLADYLVLLEAGQVIACGTLGDVTARPDLPLARDDDAHVVITARVGSHDEDWHLTRLDFAGGSIQVARREAAVGRATRISVAARDVSIALSEHADSSIVNRLPATVKGLSDTNHPAHVMIALDIGGTAMLARITRRSCEQLGLAEGTQVWAQIKSVALIE